jgi:cardiolipin synthase
MPPTLRGEENHGSYSRPVNDRTLRPPAGGGPPSGEVDSLYTIPNLFTLLRLLCLPVFLYLLFGRDNPAGAAWLLGGLGATDWVDGYLARRLGQVSEFGKKFDPTVDRLLFIVALVAIIVDEAAPIWFCVAVLARELLVGGTIAIATVFFGMTRFDVTFWGKLATFLLMFAIPGFMLGYSDFPGHTGFLVASWLVGIPGLVISWVTAVGYIPKIRAGIAAGRAG